MRAGPPFTHLGKYRVVRELGRGSMGVVYLAEDATLQRQVAIKTLQLPDTPREREHLEARFRQEAKAAGGLNHPGIITIHDLGRQDDWLYIAMELLQGTELRERMAQGPLPLDQALDIAAQVASALATAHARGVVHRDIKPGNIMLLPNAQAKIMDFGIARMQSSDLRTQSGTMLGSPKYMSPEQVAGHAADHRSDIFSLGSVLYEMVAGVPAFGGDNLGQLLGLIQRGHPPPPGRFRPGVPASLEIVIARAMQKNPAARYQDAAEMARDLLQCRSTLTRARSDTLPPMLPVDIDSDSIFGALPAAATLLQRPAPGLMLSPQFDSTLGMQTLLQSGGDTVAPPPARPVRRRGRLLWAFAYLAAAAAAMVIAFAG